ncbi:MAG: NUDIX hydrolase [Bacilli bacterium]|nr:NUDIX hydrolase [Bacilli bacterium]
MTEYKTEEEFLKAYDSSEFEKLSMTSDILILSVSNQETTNYRKNDRKMMSVLLVKRDDFPYKNKWCLPGGFLDPRKETLEECAKRVLKRETNLSDIYLEQLYTYDSINRDPRMRVVSTAFVALIDREKLTEKVENASWFDIVLYEEKDNLVDLTLDNGQETINFSIQKVLKEKTTDRYQFITNKNNDLAFDHDLVILAGLERIRNKINYTDIVFNMMPEYFTLGELQQVYEVILNKKLLDPAFRRIIADKVVKTTKMKTGEGHRPSALFKYKEHEKNK